MEKRKLTNEEIKDIFQVIKINKYYSQDVGYSVCLNIRKTLAKQLQDIQIYPSAIEKLKQKIKEMYQDSLVQPGEMVGVIAASSIGADTTQASLNSVEWNTRVFIDKDGKTIESCIGEIIDEEFKNGFKTLNYTGQVDEKINNPFAEVLDITDKNWTIPSVDYKGVTSWKKITQLIRHPLYTGLIEVTTESGRKVTATTGLSFLVVRDKEIIPINGSELSVGDRLPVSWKLPTPNSVKTHLNLREYLSPLEYIYGNDLWKARECRDSYLAKGLKKSTWWKNHNGIDFKLPFKRSDVAMDSLEGVKKCKINNPDILKGYVYNHIRSSAQNLIPENIELDELFGFFIGAYISDGCSSDNYIAISKYDEDYIKRIKEIADKWHIKTHYTSIGYKYVHMNKYEENKGREVTEKMKEMESNSGHADIRLHSTLINIFISNTCGKGSLNKRIPDFAYNASPQFIKGMLDGLFSGDGTISYNVLMYYSISERLIDGILTILSMINVFGVKKQIKKQETNNKGSKVIHQVYVLEIKHKNTERLLDFVKTLTIKSKNEKFQEMRDIKKHFNIYKDLEEKSEENYLLEDIVADRIVSITPINTETYVYDFTVEDTKIFMALGNLFIHDSFHSSGLGNKANITSGLVRQQELLNASKTVKTPSCQIYLNPDVVNVKDLLSVMEYCHQEFIYYELENLIISYTINKNPELSEEEKGYYNFFKTFYDNSFEECEWRVRVMFNLEKMYLIKKDLKWITNLIYTALHNSQEHISIIFFPNEMGQIDIWVKDNMSSLDYIVKQVAKKKTSLSKEKKLSVESIELDKYVNDENKVMYFIKSIIIPSIKRIPVSGIFGIEECYYTESGEGWFIENTKGSNLRELLNHPGVLISKTMSNNMWDIYECFGIEATHSFLLQEFRKIISSVNKRHLDVLIDSMTASGKISAVSRYGIDRKQVGPLSKACFEQPVENFLISATKGEEDRLNGVTSNVCMGKLNKMGTGLCDVLLDITKIQEAYQKFGQQSQEVEETVAEEIDELHIEDDDYLI